MVTVPSQYQSYVTQAAQNTGLPESVVAAQVNEESGFNPNAVSPTGAEGFWQFEPGTYNAVAGQAGVSPGSEFNVADETKAYIVLMNQLLQQEGGNVFKALEAYNAGPGNLNAGSGYAATILANAGQPQNLTSSSAANTTGLNISNPLNILNPFSGLNFGNVGSDITGGIISGISTWFTNQLGVPSLKDAMQRLGLILLGVILVIVGISIISKGPITSVVKAAAPVAETAALWLLTRLLFNRKREPLHKS